MEKIQIYHVLWFILDYSVLFYPGKTESYKLYFCENSKPELVTCPDDEIISSKKITYDEFPCQDFSNSHTCHSNIDDYFNANCIGQNNCTLPIELSFSKTCQRPPRRLKVYFECSRGFWWRNKHPAPVDTCANSLENVNCPSKYHIHIQNCGSYSKSICDGMDNTCAINTLKRLCNEKQRCLPDISKTSCLFHRRFANIQYTCKGIINHSVTSTIPSTSSDHGRDTVTTAFENDTFEYPEMPELSLDKDHRVVSYQPSQSETQYLCSHGWDDKDAVVLCRYFNQTWLGHSTVVDKLLDIPIAPYSLHCNGLETSLLKCNSTENPTSCNTSKVAGAVCCQEANRRGQCVRYSVPQKATSEKSESSTLGMLNGCRYTSAIIMVVCVIVVIAFIRRRYVSKDSIRKRIVSNNSDDDYVGQQNIALPQYPSNKKVPKSQVTKNSTNTTENEDDQSYSYPSKDSQSLYALSEEGLYDKTNERRHVVNDTDAYSRTIDTVYDSTEQNTRLDRKEETYDHVFGQKTEDYYDKSKRI
ncbi:Hypothetical predicted protein [Mytilus galloprovincialis]|uniref:SRCR domain-containing protein n=1 Tax=Mytilus galloprovincialis TaxID=29158 RepID=A0A8B6CRR0_MYTGA|nr:Hypothetical predicted protein [Mytilus galloprovincialis]